MDTSSHSTGKKSHQSLLNAAPLIVLIALVLCGLSFWGGMTYQKGHNKVSSASASGQLGAGGGFRGRFGGQRPIIGQVKAVSATSITVSDTNSDSSTTLAITSSTQITNNGQTASASDIQTGDQVLVQKSTTDTSQASRIVLNPSFGNNFPAASGSAGTSTN